MSKKEIKKKADKKKSKFKNYFNKLISNDFLIMVLLFSIALTIILSNYCKVIYEECTSTETLFTCIIITLSIYIIQHNVLKNEEKNIDDIDCLYNSFLFYFKKTNDEYHGIKKLYIYHNRLWGDVNYTLFYIIIIIIIAVPIYFLIPDFLYLYVCFVFINVVFLPIFIMLLSAFCWGINNKLISIKEELAAFSKDNLIKFEKDYFKSFISNITDNYSKNESLLIIAHNYKLLNKAIKAKNELIEKKNDEKCSVGVHYRTYVENLESQIQKYKIILSNQYYQIKNNQN
jgi:hypothetical protein